MQPNQDKQFQLPATPQLAGLDEKKETKKENKEKTTPVQEVQKWSSRYNTAKDYQKDLFKKWGKWYNDMYAHVENKRMAPWRSKVYMPIIASKVWDLISRFIQYRPGWEVSVRTLPVNTLSTEQFNKYMEVMSKRAERVRMKLEYDFDNPLLGDSIPDELLSVMLDAAVTGQGVARVPYLTDVPVQLIHSKRGYCELRREENRVGSRGIQRLAGCERIQRIPHARRT